MAQPTLVRNNRAYVEISIPFDAGAALTHIYVAAGPFETFVKKLTVPHLEKPAASGLAPAFWNHREFGFPDHGTRYFIKVTTETGAGAETPLESSPKFEVKRSTGEESIPIVLARPAPMPTLADFSSPLSTGDFVISVRDFRTFRLLLDVIVPDGAIEFRVDTAAKRAGPFRPHQVSTDLGSGVIDLDNGLFQVKSTGVASLDIDVRESAFIRLMVRENGGTAGNKEITSIEIERLGRVAMAF